MDIAKESGKDGPPSYVPGTIKKIKLQNFMCHDSFELDFGSRVNFIIGPNGSGKSALLTAIVVVLGGRASTTSRAKRNSEFVQYGKHTAKITLELHNYDKIMEKDKAFKPDEYGKKIIIEKIIPKDPELSAKLVIKNDKEKRVSERKQELDEMLDFFKIQTNNPICILNQEVSKSFLHSKRPEDKFDLFMKATNLEQIETDYNEAKESHKEWDDCNTRKEFAFRILDNEKHKCTEKLNFIMNRCKLQEESHKCSVELIWALLRDHEVEASSITEQLDSKKSEIGKSDVEIKRHNEKIREAELRIAQHNVKVETCQTDCDASKKKRDDLRDKEFRVNTRRLEVQGIINKETHKLSRIERDKASLEKSIDEVRNNQNNRDSVMENEKTKLEIEHLKKDKLEYEAKEKALRQRTDQINRSLTEIHQEVNKAHQKVESIKSDVSASDAHLKNLIASQGGDLNKYGKHAERIYREVERAFQTGRFKKRPYGPIGRYIKLRNPDVSAALEIHLGAFAKGYICDNNSDMLTLERIFKSVKASVGDAGFQDPHIYVRQFKNRFDPSKFKAVHSEHKSLIDLVEVSEDAVFNALLDRNFLEQALYIPDYNEALNIMMTPNMVPTNTRVAYTKDNHMMYPRTRDQGFRSIADDRRLNFYFSKCNQELIAAKKREIDDLKQSLRKAEEEYGRLSDSHKVQRSEYNASIDECKNVVKKCREIEYKLLELQTKVAEDQPQELSVFEDELEKCMATIHETKMAIEAEKFKLEGINAELSDIKREKDEATRIHQLRGEELDKVRGDIGQEKALISRHRETIRSVELAVTKYESDAAKLTKQLDNINREIATHEASLREQERPAIIRATDIVRSRKKKIDAALCVEIEENRDPDELMANLRKRMEEIDQMTTLKDHNLQNYSMTARSLKDRDEGLRNLKKSVCNSVSTTFSSMTRFMDMAGELAIYMDDKVVNGQLVGKAKTLQMSVDTSRSMQRAEALSMSDNNVSGDQPTRRSIRSQPEPDEGPSRSKRSRSNMSPSEKENNKMTDTRSLSGGERSFSTVAFVLALWYHCQSPFKLMDEIDVFMDMVTRRMSYNALIRFARTTEAPGQFIYFSPLSLPEILEGSEDLVRVFEMPRIIRRGVQSLPTNLELENL